MAKKSNRGGKREGAGRKVSSPDGPTVTMAVTVPGGLLEQLDAYAAEQSWNRSEAVTRAIRGLLDKRKPTAKN
jgi:hypothetical protein